MWLMPNSIARAQHGQRLVVVARRPEYAGAGQLHGAETDAADSGTEPKREGLHGTMNCR